ncbi:hypothetical protein [Salimicrobium salexigens]|uniref:Uncharacterized protein n=1 Tax=Salimicrobium salexigens TaxID=908941 RepID=A0ABY1L332_9BACI|nr:hypothetical protein [Salimicrobium salexigens]SIS97950.1 hypothetical protein SAMN05421758_11530 [Salimicrobium salexigens]
MSKLPPEVKEKIIKLKASKRETSDLIGLNCIIILSKEIFKKNEDLKNYTDNVFQDIFLPYLFKSRTLLIARTTRNVYRYDETEKAKFVERIYDFFEDDFEVKESKKKSYNKANENMRKWMRALDKND